MKSRDDALKVGRKKGAIYIYVTDFANVSVVFVLKRKDFEESKTCLKFLR